VWVTPQRVAQRRARADAELGERAALTAYARSVPLTSATGEEWVAHAGLNAIGVAVILHVAIGRRWPFAAADPVTGSG